jgi:hypothetical protein
MFIPNGVAHLGQLSGGPASSEQTMVIFPVESTVASFISDCSLSVNLLQPFNKFLAASDIPADGVETGVTVSGAATILLEDVSGADTGATGGVVAVVVVAVFVTNNGAEVVSGESSPAAAVASLSDCTRLSNSTTNFFTK